MNDRRATSERRGHRAIPHTADVILEAWAPSMAACWEEAVAALLDTCVDVSTAPVVERLRFAIEPAAADEMLLELLDHVVFVLDTSDAVPARVTVDIAADERAHVVLDLVDRSQVESAGAVPKAISRSELRAETDTTGARCSFLVDV